jgi:hypothetical protein
MKKLFTLLALLTGGTAAYAGPGDTTVVQAHATMPLSKPGWYGDYDSTIAFPSGATPSRNVYMTFTLGKYACPPGSQYCASWDYTVQTFLMTPGGDTLELGRLITPYAQTGNPSTPANWTRRYTFDVTDYASLLKNNATIRVHYSGYSGGFTADVKFYFIEGTPARPVTGIKTLWQGDYAYGNATNPIDTRIAAKSYTAPAGTVDNALKVTITGHGGDGNNNCAEFCQQNYYVKLNSAAAYTKLIWRDDCGYNQMYPQGGTWIYDRGNWCPGDLVHVNSHPLAIAAGSTGTVDVDFDAYNSVPSGSGSTASYTFQGVMVSYGAFNRQKDVGMLDVVSPTNHESFVRNNPSCSGPVVRLKNWGATPITSMKIQYGVQGGTGPTTYNWTGTLASGEMRDVALPINSEIKNIVGLNTFYAKVLEVNGTADEEGTNNEVTSTFTGVPVWEQKIVVRFKNNVPVNETAWKITDEAGTVIASRTGAASGAQYLDTVSLKDGCYKFVMTDNGCDGLNWLNNQQVGTGSIAALNAQNGFPFTMPDNYGGNFGCGFEHQFRVIGPVGVGRTELGNLKMEAFPNPATNLVTVTVPGNNIAGTLEVYDVTGRLMHREAATGASQLNVAAWATGVYTAQFVEKTTGARVYTRFEVIR